MENLSELKQSSELAAANTKRRNALIVEARQDGYPWAAIKEAAGLSLMGVQAVAKRENGGVLPKPRQQQG